jgi:hypothetical protein
LLPVFEWRRLKYGPGAVRTMDHLSTNTVVIEAVCRVSTPVDLMSLIAVNTVWQAVGLGVYREKLTESIASACVDIIGDVPCRPASGTDSP